MTHGFHCYQDVSPLVETVNFHQRIARRIVYPGQNGGVIGGGESSKDSCFKSIGRCITTRVDFCHLGIGPIIISHDGIAIGVAKIEKRIGKRIWNIKRSLANSWPQAANDHILAAGTFYDETNNHDVTASLHKCAGGDVAQAAGRAIGIQIVTFYERDSASVSYATDNGGIAAGSQAGEDGWLLVVGRRVAAGTNRRRIRRITPIVVRGNQRTVAAMQL